MRGPQSAGILLYRLRVHVLEVLLAHPGGPFWANKDEGAWTIPKGSVEPGEDLLETAIREFEEEIGMEPPGPFIPLGSVLQRGGKTVYAWACEGDFDPRKLKSNTVKTVWPPGSGRFIKVPEVDKCAWFNLEAAAKKINSAQRELLETLRSTIL